ncbi:MAG TPA: Asp-tRNA(Asn)/Glu-tRNA(Gln) amidotransferase subunit GatC [Vitreimonas sp.]|nr:Asp-tRNA(Asn)/Glu-tRNA(Gln) amidotransferase subunit GatC [Vitreimonas sp.]
MSSHITKQQVQHVAQLANIPLSDEEAANFAKAFDETLDVIDELKAVDVTGVEPTSQVTGLENVFRDDVVNNETMFSQTQALANAKQTHDGFIVVPQVIDQGD